MTVKINFKKDRLDMSIGAGGRAMNRLLDQLIFKAFDNEYLNCKNDQAILPPLAGKLALTTDSFVVTPYFFPGGDIGSLAIHGTINDLAVGGAKPLYLSAGFILEEGLPLADLKIIVESMAQAAQAAGLPIVTGDTKVVEKGKGDGIFINTTGVGVVPTDCTINHRPLVEGDHMIINGRIAEHGVAVMSKRENLGFAATVRSDSAALHHLIDQILATGVEIKAMRDPTRGGIAATLNEWAEHYQVGITIDERCLPVSEEVAAACELLGLDPIFIANEGKVLVACAAEDSERVLQAMRAHPLGREAQLIAEVTAEQANFVAMKTSFGGIRRVNWLSGEQLPRIC